MDDVAGFLERFWLGLWNERAMDQMIDLLDPEYRQVDRRPLTMSGETREDWRRLMETWWEMLPDGTADAVRMLREDGDRAAYLIEFSGTDRIGGGRVEILLYVVNRFAGGRFLEAALFDDEASAVACFERGG